jgi:aminomethyltransferase
MPNNSFIDLSVANLENVRVSTTGYTGEPGYELYCANEQAEPLYRALIKAGEAFGLAPCGLGARDTLRLEMKYPLYGNDIDLDHNPIEAGLGWVVKFAKDNFKGKAALEASKNAGPTRRWVGIKMLDKGIARHGYAVQKEGVQIGIVTSGTHSPSLGEAIATCYVQKQFSEIGTQLHVMIRDKAMLAEVVETPFYKRTK